MRPGGPKSCSSGNWPSKKIAILHDDATYGKGVAEEVTCSWYQPNDRFWPHCRPRGRRNALR
jgi:hypothetical protein